MKIVIGVVGVRFRVFGVSEFDDLGIVFNGVDEDVVGFEVGVRVLGFEEFDFIVVFELVVFRVDVEEGGFVDFGVCGVFGDV